jgi:hypothetical protein
MPAAYWWTGCWWFPDLGFVEVWKLVLLGLGAESQLVNVVDDLAEDLADLVLKSIWATGLAVKPCK